MVTLGVKRVRFDMSWSDIQFGGAATFDWAKYDSLVAAITALGITPLAIIAYTPTWARPSGCTNDDKCAPASLSNDNTFVSAAVNCYKSNFTWSAWSPMADTPTSLRSAAVRLVEKALMGRLLAFIALTGGAGRIAEIGNW